MRSIIVMNRLHIGVSRRARTRRPVLKLLPPLPTMIVGFTRYSRDQSFSILKRSRSFVLVIALGSIVGTFIGGQLLGIIPSSILLPLLAGILIASAIKVWRHS